MQNPLRLIYPHHCLTCDTLTGGPDALCGDCWGEVSFLNGSVCGKCGAQVMSEVDGMQCDDCLHAPRPWSAGRSVFHYSGFGRRMVLGIKHGDRLDLVRPAAKWMAQHARPLRRDNMLVVPIPLHWSRLFGRRYNQSAELARGIAQQMGLQYGPDILQRPKRTPMLEGKTRDDRLNILSGAITINPKRALNIAQRSILLVDDVMTTGATLSEAANVLASSRAGEVFVITLARAGKDT